MINEKEFTLAIDYLWQIVKGLPNIDEEAIFKLHPIICEIDEFGPDGPVGLGMGKYGGHTMTINSFRQAMAEKGEELTPKEAEDFVEKIKNLVAIHGVEEVEKQLAVIKKMKEAKAFNDMILEIGDEQS